MFAKRLCRSAGLLGLALALIHPRPVAAAWPTDPLVNVPLCVAANDQNEPVTTPDDCGGAITAWFDFRSGTSFDIYAQRVLSSGEVDPTWPADGRALCAHAGDQTYPAIAADGTGGAIVAWADRRSSTNYDIYAQHVLASGAVDPAWPADGRAVRTTANGHSAPTLVADGAGGAIIAWEGGPDAGLGSADIMAQHLLADGTLDPTWPTEGLSLCTATNRQSEPMIVADGSGGAIVVWNDLRNGTEWDIYAQRVLGDGGTDPAWPSDGLAVCAAAGQQLRSAAIPDGAGGAIVTWGDGRNSTNSKAYAQHVLASGAVDPAWPADGRAVCAAPNDQSAPTLVSDGVGGAIVSWHDCRNGISNSDIYALHLLSDGSPDPVWPVNGRALCSASNRQLAPQPISDGEGGAIVTWWDRRNGTDWDLYAQRVLANGVVDAMWPGDGLPVCRAMNSQISRSIVEDGVGGGIITWSDGRSDGGDIYAQRVQGNGQLGGTTVGVSVQGEVPFMLDAVRPNPHRGGALIVSFTLASPSPTSLELLDVAGRRVTACEVGSLGAGHHSLDLAIGGRIPVGLYFVRLRQGTSVRVQRVAILS
ncbi:MAG TPA: T9SS type A sorting domain-containing protein [Candidatus Eisenbacteria bacterium]|nr:T9SS type A sorting domain-containing protein [Candidatus Eisenbacteria bacterium]